MLVSPATGAIDVAASGGNDENVPVNDVTQGDFTHAVLAEYGTLSYCSHCPPASDALYSIYQSGDYPFYYVTLVSDKNPIVKERLYYLHMKYAPTVYFDGGYLIDVGTAGSPQADETIYRSSIEKSGVRTVTCSLDMNTSVTWEGNAKITVTVTVTNNGNSFYLGVLRSYVTEIESRWNDQSGDPYHFGFLDFAMKKLVFISPGKTYATSATWDGVEEHDGQTFEDITEDNIMVVSSVSHWLPHLYQDEESDKSYLQFYVDQTSGAVPVQVASTAHECKGNGEGYTNVTAQEAWDMLNCSCDGRQIPIDVRMVEEFIEERIDVPLPEDWVRVFPLNFKGGAGPIQRQGLLLRLFMMRYKGEEIIIYCGSGRRSFIATQILIENNFNGKIYNMVGGIGAWKAAGLPTVKGLMPSL